MTHSVRAREIVMVLAVLVLLEAVVFGGYFTGSVIPQFDFISGYNTEAYAWWKDGGFFDPPQWMSYLWGGYPAVSDLQNSSYYLPVGIVAAFVPLTLHVSAIISALHVAFGAVGTYVFARRWGARVLVAMVGLAGWFFAAGFYSNATQLDISRAYAWLPWIMLITSVKWPWHKPWAIGVGLLIIWQAVLGIYPGMIVALAYVLPFWILLNQLFFRPRLRHYLIPMLVTGVAAIAMTMLRFLPALLERGHSSGVFPDQSGADFASIGTLLYPYNNPVLPSYEVMASFFVPAVFLPLLAFLPWRDRLVRALAVITAIALVLGLPNWPWHNFVTFHLPGMLLSRFRMSDFKFIILFAVVAAGVYALERLVAAATDTARGTVPGVYAGRITRWVPIVLLVLLNLLFAFIGIRYKFDVASSLPEWLILAGSSALVYILFLRGRGGDGPLPARDLRPILASLTVLAIVSGVVGAFGVQDTWRADRPVAEVDYLGASVDSLIAERTPATNLPQRPARIPSPPHPTDPNEIYWQYGSSFYDGQASVFGYVNLRGTQTYDEIKAQLYAPGVVGVDTAAFWAAPGIVIEGDAATMPSARQVELCDEDRSCGAGLTEKPVLYNRSGTFVYDLVATTPETVMLNEAYYKGWAVTSCSADGKDRCVALQAHRGKAGQIVVSIPAGHTQLRLHYELPGYWTAWALFGLGILPAAGLAVWLGLSLRPRRRVAPPSLGEGSTATQDRSPA